MLSWFGVLALVQSVISQACIGPIVLFVGLMVNEEALDFTPHRRVLTYLSVSKSFVRGLTLKSTRNLWSS